MDILFEGELEVGRNDDIGIDLRHSLWHRSCLGDDAEPIAGLIVFKSHVRRLRFGAAFVVLRLRDLLSQPLCDQAALPPDSIFDETLLLVLDRKSTRLNSSHLVLSYAVYCLKNNNSHAPP